MSTVEIRDLVKTFGSTVAVDRVSLSIGQGEIVALLGPSGCGKTSTLRCVAGLERPTSGLISIGGRCVTSNDQWVPPERRGVGLMFQSYALWPHKTVFQNVALGLQLRRFPRERIKSMVADMLELLELPGLGERYPSQLSGGQQQRVALARSLVVEPKVLLLDEPLSNLDAKIRERVRTELRDLLKSVGITSIYVTHDQGEAMAISDRVVVMNRGRIEQEGAPRDVYLRPASRFVADFVGWANFVPVRVLEENGADGLARLETDSGLQVWTGAAVSGSGGVMAFRPEDARVVPAPTSINSWSVRVDKQTFLGFIVETQVLLGGTGVRLIGVDVPVGSAFNLHVPPDRVLYFAGDPR